MVDGCRDGQRGMERKLFCYGNRAKGKKLGLLEAEMFSVAAKHRDFGDVNQRC